MSEGDLAVHVAARRHIAILIRANDRQITVAVADPSDTDLDRSSVLATLLANDPVGAVARFLDLGIDRRLDSGRRT